MRLCRCRNQQRYYSVRCDNVRNHGVWADLPPFVDFVMTDAAKYHDQVTTDGTVTCVHEHHGQSNCAECGEPFESGETIVVSRLVGAPLVHKECFGEQ